MKNKNQINFRSLANLYHLSKLKKLPPPKLEKNTANMNSHQSTETTDGLRLFIILCKFTELA